MKKFFVWLIIILFLLGSYGVYLILIFSKQNTTPTTTVTTSVELSDKILIFHSKNCPVCKELKKYVENYKIAEQLHNIQGKKTNIMFRCIYQKYKNAILDLIVM